MKHIPIEILREIFTNLDLKDKLTCMLVCRFWYDTLDHFTLLCHLSVNITQFTKLKDMLDRFPHRTSQVEYLRIDKCLQHKLEKREICSMLPNLREISFSRYTDQSPLIHTSKLSQFSHTTCKLEKISDFGECELAPQLAMSDLCDNLKTLELDLDGLPISGTSDIISQLKNMPVLEEVRMGELQFRLMDLEVIHSNLPSLRRLYLKNAQLFSGEIAQDVTPASLVTELEVDLREPEDQYTHIQFYKYIGNKYPSIRNPILDYDLGDSSTQADNIAEVYNEGIFPLYQKIGSQVDTFIFTDYYQELEAFRKFDDYGIKLKELIMKMSWMFPDEPFIEELVESQQSKTIQKLSLLDIIPEPINMLSNMEVLATLEITGSYFHSDDGHLLKKEINLTQLINACPPTLTTLSMDNIHFTFDGPTSNTTSIQHLTITNVKLLPDLGTIIETSFPKLSTLELNAEITTNVTISLLNHKLEEVNISAMDYEDQDEHVYTMEWECDDGIKYYAIRRTTKSNDESKPVESVAVRFVCPSVELFFSAK